MNKPKGALTVPDIRGFNVANLLRKIGKLPGPAIEPKTGQAVMRKMDDRTISQLQNAGFSGIRANEIWNRFEIWILGRIANTVAYQEIFLNPQRLNLVYCETFGIDHINLDAKTQHEMDKLDEIRREMQEPEIQDALSKLKDPTLQEKADIKTIVKDKSKEDNDKQS